MNSYLYIYIKKKKKGPSIIENVSMKDNLNILASNKERLLSEL